MSRQTNSPAGLGFSGAVLAPLAIFLVLLLVAAACSNPEPEITRAELLAEVEGRELSEAEVEERTQVMQALCRMDDAVLLEMWSEMNNEQLAFQDIVITEECPQRINLYATATGRFVADE